MKYSVLLGSPYDKEPITIKKIGGKRPLKVESVIKDKKILDQIQKYDLVRSKFFNMKKDYLDDFIKQQFITASMLYEYLPEYYFVIDHGNETFAMKGEQYCKITLTSPRVSKETIDRVFEEYLIENKLSDYIKIKTFTIDKSHMTQTILLLKKISK